MPMLYDGLRVATSRHTDSGGRLSVVCYCRPYYGRFTNDLFLVPYSCSCYYTAIGPGTKQSGNTNTSTVGRFRLSIKICEIKVSRVYVCSNIACGCQKN